MSAHPPQVGNIPMQPGLQEKLVSLFSRFGPVDGCRLLKAVPDPRRPAGHYVDAVVMFARTKSCRKAVKERIGLTDPYGTEKRLAVEPLDMYAASALETAASSPAAGAAVFSWRAM